MVCLAFPATSLSKRFKNLYLTVFPAQATRGGEALLHSFISSGHMMQIRIPFTPYRGLLTHKTNITREEGAALQSEPRTRALGQSQTRSRAPQPTQGAPVSGGAALAATAVTHTAPSPCQVRLKYMMNSTTGCMIAATRASVTRRAGIECYFRDLHPSTMSNVVNPGLSTVQEESCISTSPWF